MACNFNPGGPTTNQGVQLVAGWEELIKWLFRNTTKEIMKKNVCLILLFLREVKVFLWSPITTTNEYHTKMLKERGIYALIHASSIMQDRARVHTSNNQLVKQNVILYFVQNILIDLKWSRDKCAMIINKNMK